MKEQPPGPDWIVALKAGLFIGSYVQILEKNLPVFNNGIGIGKLHFTISDRFDLGSFQFQTGFDRNRDMVVVPPLAIPDDDLDLLPIFLHANRIGPASGCGNQKQKARFPTNQGYVPAG